MLDSGRCTNFSASVNLMGQNILLLLEYFSPEISAEYLGIFLALYIVCIQCHIETQMVSIRHCYSNSSCVRLLAIE